MTNTAGFIIGILLCRRVPYATNKAPRLSTPLAMSLRR
jgi:hypothetical protein